MPYRTQPEDVRIVALSKKSSAAAVSSWGFSGYITVLPKEPKQSGEKKKEQPAVTAKYPQKDR